MMKASALLVLLVGCSHSESGDDPPDGGGPGPGPDGGSSSDGAPECLAAEAPCSDGAECCGGLLCDQNSLGQVCCGGFGASCATASGTDCCGPLECSDGVCGGTWDPGTPNLIVFPVRGPHDVGYASPSTGDPSMWSCDDAHSNSDFIAGNHLGNDIWAARGTPVAATVNGTLVNTGWSDYSGNKVTVRTSGGWYHFNCHLDSIAPGMVNGTQVTAGQIIGTVGATGTASNGVVHLHYSIYPDDDYNAGVNPWPYLNEVEWHVCD